MCAFPVCSSKSSCAMQEVDAREVAKATGVDFGDDAVGAIMKKYDTNGDGVFQVNEYAAPPQTRRCATLHLCGL